MIAPIPPGLEQHRPLSRRVVLVCIILGLCLAAAPTASRADLYPGAENSGAENSGADRAGAENKGIQEEAPYLPLRAERLRELAERIAKEVVRVEVIHAAQEGSLVPAPHFDGGGIHVGGGRILTSAFLLRDAVEIRVRFADGSTAAARAGKSSAKKGLAIVECDAARGLAVPEIAPAPAPLIGATVYLHSNPGAPQPALAIGYWVEPPGAAFYGRASLPARNGHPLYEVYGRVIGLAVLPAKAGLGSLVVPAWAIRKFLGMPIVMKKKDDE